MVQPVPRAGEEVNRRKHLKRCQRPWRVTCENDRTPIWRFEVTNTSNLGLGALAHRPACLAHVSYAIVLLLCRSTELVAGTCADHRSSCVSQYFFRSLFVVLFKNASAAIADT